jgi:hypothetical protein
VLRLEQWR